MGQKINPISLRLQNTNRYFDFCWYSKYFYSDLLSQDLKIQKYLNSIFKQLQYPSSRFFIQNSQKKSKIFAFFCTPIKSRRISSNFFKTKYHKITKRVLISRKNRISKFLKKKNSTKIVFSLTHLNKKRSVFLKYLLYHKFLSNYYCGKKEKLQHNRRYNLQSTQFTTKQHSVQPQTYSRIYQPNYKMEGETLGSPKGLLTPCKTVLFSKLKNLKVLSNFSMIPPYSYLKFHPESFPQKIIHRKLYKAIILARNLFLKKKNHLWTQKGKKPSKMMVSQKSLVYNYDKTKVRQLLSKNGKKQTKLLSNFDPLLQENRVKDEIKKVEKLDTSVDSSFFFIKSLFFHDVKKTENCKKVLSEKNISLYQYLDKLSFRKHMENILTSELSTNFNIYWIKTYDHYRSALFLAEEIVYYLERRIPFRRIKNKILKEVKFITAVQGIRIACSGRVSGRSKKAQRAKTQTVKYGQTSLHVFSAHIDFASKKALTRFGLVGVKVWICYKSKMSF